MDLEKLLRDTQLFSVVFAAADITEDAVWDALAEVAGAEMVGTSVRPQQEGLSIKATVTHDSGLNRALWFERIKGAARGRGWAFAIAPDRPQFPDFRLAVMDMDSTLINQEVIEELASFAGMREHVAEVTRLAMEGKLDFHQALRERVKLLEGQPESILDEVYEKHITATPGLEELLAGFRARGIVTVVVSGGFIRIVGKFAEKHGLDHALANTLEVRDGRLTGVVTGEIVDSEVKRRTLLEMCEKLHCDPSQAIAIGDGANDLKMIQASGLGVAFCAKAIVQDQALAAVNRRRLDDVLAFLPPV